MRRKLVLWGNNASNEKILVGLELNEKENVVNIFTFPEKVATESFYKDMSENWKDDKEVEFPEGFTKIERKLTVSDSILPDDIRVDKPELVTRAQTEWHFVVLSSKLYELYKSEIEELKEKIDGITEYDNKVWDELKSFWTKVQDQVHERNLFREQGAFLKEKTNTLFDKLKAFKKDFDDQYENKSKEFVSSFEEQLETVKGKIESGLALNPLFEELKAIQHKIFDTKFTKHDKESIAKKVDEVFKFIKEKRGNKTSNSQQSTLGHLDNRLNGLLVAIQKMQSSIAFDQKELDFQQKKVNDSDGQLETQLRQAKINIVSERLTSKKEKLDDMLKIKAELTQKLSSMQDKAAKSAKMEEAKESAKQKIADSIQDQSAENEKNADKLNKAAEELGGKSKLSTLTGAIFDSISNLTENVSELVEDFTDTAKAVAVVAEEKFENLKDTLEDIADDIEDKAENIGDKIKDDLKDVADKAKEKFETYKDKAEDVADSMGDKVEDMVDSSKEKFDSTSEKVEETTEAVVDNTESAIEKKVDEATEDQKES